MREPYSYDPQFGTPAGPAILYTCLICGAEVRSMPEHHQRWTCTCRNISVDPDAGRCSIRTPTQFSISRVIDVRNAFCSKTFTIHTPIGELLLGIIDADIPGAAASVSWLLNRSISDALASKGGHLPDWLVGDIRQNYISPSKIQSLWAKHGYRFALARADDGEMLGTVHITRNHDTIFTIDRHILNVSAKDYPGFKPEGAHHLVNLSVKHEVRRAGIGRAMIDGILQYFREQFDGDALWVRADPPWHAGLVGLGFSHDPSMDIFLPAEVERTSNLPHALFNARYACECQCPWPQKPEFLARRALAMQSEKLQYISFKRPFEAIAHPSPGSLPRSPLDDLDKTPPDPRYFRDWGGSVQRIPKGVFTPRTVQELTELLRRASAHKVPITLRGLGRSAGGQALSDGGLVLCTEGLNQIDLGSLGPDRITVQGGVSWDKLIQSLLPHGLVPPVVPGFLSVTVGGTLSSGGFSKGSIQRGFQMDQVLGLQVATGDGRLVECSPTQARWLFDAVLGGLGRFGVIVSATLALEKAPRGILKTELNTGGDIEALLQNISAFAAQPDAYHATGFVKADASGALQDMAVCARARDGEGDISFARYIMPERELSPRGPTLWAHVFCPSSAMKAVLSLAKAILRPKRGDTLQWLPIRKTMPERSLVRVADVAVGELFYAVLLMRGLGEWVSAQEVEEENRAFVEQVIRLGGKNAMGGILPRDSKEWRAHLGEDMEELLRLARMADPAGVLGFGI